MTKFNIKLLNFQTWTGSPPPPPCQSPPPHTGEKTLKPYSQIFETSEYLDIFSETFWIFWIFGKLDMWIFLLPTQLEHFGHFAILQCFPISSNLAFLHSLRCWNCFLKSKSKVHNISGEKMSNKVNQSCFFFVRLNDVQDVQDLARLQEESA